MNKYKGITTTLIINTLTIIVTVLATLLSISSLSETTLQFLCIIIIIVLAVICLISYLFIAAGDLKEQQETLRRLTNNNDFLQAIPHFIYFEKREDRFSVLENGDGDLQWDFYIVKETDERFFLYIPVCFERNSDDSTDNSLVKIFEATLNGINNDATYKRSQIITTQSDVTIETGHIEVPVLLEAERKEFHLSIKLRIEQLFKQYDKQEFIIVDIPYITKELQVSIKPPDGHAFNVPNPFFEAQESNAFEKDIREIDKQLAFCTINQQGLLWRTIYPKLGYRYKIYFSSKANDNDKDNNNDNDYTNLCNIKKEVQDA